jgi:hypothetical protein
MWRVVNTFSAKDEISRLKKYPFLDSYRLNFVTGISVKETSVANLFNNKNGEVLRKKRKT